MQHWICLGLLVMAGCTSVNGPLFTEIGGAPQNVAQIYFYRLPGFISGGGGIFPIYDNEHKISPSLATGGYLIYYADEGEHQFNTKSTLAIDRPVVIDVEAKETYFFRLDYDVNLFVDSLWLTRVSRATAEKQLRKCRHIRDFDDEPH